MLPLGVVAALAHVSGVREAVRVFALLEGKNVFIVVKQSPEAVESEVLVHSHRDGHLVPGSARRIGYGEGEALDPCGDDVYGILAPEGADSQSHGMRSLFPAVLVAVLAVLDPRAVA